MPIITISRGSYYHGRSIAEKVADKLGYPCYSRDQLIDNMEEFHLPEIKLVRGLNDAFSVLDRFPHGKKRFITAIRASILQLFLTGNVVYHGLFGHHFVRNISHVLKVRIIADTDRRIADEMKRENISAEKARYTLKKDDDERRKWGMFLYGIDIMDPENYNLIIRVGHLSEDEAVDIIVNAAGLSSFQDTPESRAILADSALSAQITKSLFDFPHASVSAQNGRAIITLKVPEDQQPIIHSRISEMLSSVQGLTEFALQFDPYY